ncbi:RidA family protein [Martelella mediterranea]|uniref:Enamine/imine deaminase n=1 Tax=Martelella mediterranea DSM 17316 TaxID=1122214 RepID=A0A1U9YX13_9HYPH|nr:RidA family protein [Martelella mediterranea]AQZ49976.1 Enamine/imine deaminase [Martelella mediterranea DSM 17316]
MSKIEYFHAEGGASNPAPLSPAVRAGDFVYVSGQVPTLADGSVVAHDVETQTAQVMRNIEEALKLAGCELSDICKTTVWLHDARDFARFNKAYSAFFEQGKFPARSTTEARLMINILVEIEAVAYKPV